MDRVGVLIVSKSLSAAAIVDALSGSSSYRPEFYIAEKQVNPFNQARAKVHQVIPDLAVTEVAKFAASHRKELSFGLTDTEDFIINGGRDEVEKASGVPLLCVTRRYAVERSKADQRRLFERLFKDANPRYAIFDPRKGSEAAAISSLRRFAAEVKEPVIKPDAPARGAGVGVWGSDFSSEQEMISFFRNVFSKGRVVVEEKVRGEESSFQALSDGKHFIVAPQTRDYKRAVDGDSGRLTGGMGSYRDSRPHLPFIRPSEWEAVVSAEDSAFRRWRGKGTAPGLRGFVLYDALMHTGKGFKLLERNSRGGNTEQVCLWTTMQDDPVDVCFRMVDGTLKAIRFSKKASVVTCAVPAGYGGIGASSQGGEGVDLEAAYRLARSDPGVKVYPMDVRAEADGLHMGTSRTVAVAGVDDTLEGARAKSLLGVEALVGPLRWRQDVASSESVARSVRHMAELRRSRPSA